jgi:hypothetical protein
MLDFNGSTLGGIAESGSLRPRDRPGSRFARERASRAGSPEAR